MCSERRVSSRLSEAGLQANHRPQHDVDAGSCESRAMASPWPSEGILLGLDKRGLSIEDRRQKRSLRVAVGSKAHQRHRLHDPQSLLQGPAKQLGVANGQHEPGPREGGGRPDQRLQVVSGLANGMAEEPDAGRVAGEQSSCSTTVAVPWRIASRSSPARSWP
jgi:hypothetical protein